jgi:hypothetical protein
MGHPPSVQMQPARNDIERPVRLLAIGAVVKGIFHLAEVRLDRIHQRTSRKRQAVDGIWI